MRPVERGSCPVDDQGQPKNFKTYQQARGDLINILGEYCSYCEVRLSCSLAVEHVQPKSKEPSLECEWSNFLLACTNCNSTKGQKIICLDHYYWADLDNTFRAFEYALGGIVRVNQSLTKLDKERAQNTLELIGLNKIPNPDPTVADRRWINRREAWGVAERSLKNLQQNDTVSMRKQIVETAVAKGFWSVWLTIFKYDGDMLMRLIDAFPGTCRSCFDAQGKTLPRPQGAL
jgi:uncharacterized protein (TIGR02646 family)